MNRTGEAGVFGAPSFSFGNRAARQAWEIVYVLLFKSSPRAFFGWRALLLRLFGARLGRHCKVCSSAIIWAPWNLECGDEVRIGDRAIVYSQGRIAIGRRSVISQGAHLCAGTHDYATPDFKLLTKPITVGENCWVAAEAFVMPGITIGDGTVVGARSVVTGDLPEWKVCAGNPCRVMKGRENAERGLARSGPRAGQGTRNAE